MSKSDISSISSIINFKFMNKEKYSNIMMIIDNLDLEFLSTGQIKIVHPLKPLTIQTPFLNINSIDKNKLLIDLSDDNNEINYFINFIQKLEAKINNLYHLKKKFYSFNKRDSHQNYLFYSNFIFENIYKYFLKLSLNLNKVEIDNPNHSFNISNIHNLKKTYCNLFFELSFRYILLQLFYLLACISLKDLILNN